ncbi:hypothetical protein [Comamonas sp. JC664]|uniref:hypothetical protein n=1 Tax=Comamonas sp. JC664 TaxID=2801917 RepID=UPI00188CD26E|nr:hypothetical protein [Comamonas sp. JC664]GHG96936.1 hypothetical protein GCM10012319_61510 [Comamonas sp. KCTC 72670]
MAAYALRLPKQFNPRGWLMKLRNVLVLSMAAGLMVACGGPAPEEGAEMATQEAELTTCGYVSGPESYVSAEEACEMARHFAPNFCSGLGGVQSINRFCLYTDGPPWQASVRVCCNQ